MKKIPIWMAEKHVPAVAIAFIQHGRVSETRVFGELSAGIPAPIDAIFDVASLTKPVVATLVMKLVASGKWDLDEPLQDYWIDPDLAGNPMLPKLTTRFVLSHRTGFPNWRTSLPGGKLSFMFTPGTKWGYSGEGFEYLRTAIESKFGKPLEEIAAEQLLVPFGMKDTRFHWDANMDESRIALPHDGNGNPTEKDQTFYRKKTHADGADWLMTTVGDYGKFGANILMGAGLPRKQFREMTSPQAACNIDPSVTFGLGWEIVSNLPHGEYALVHDGSDYGFDSLVILLPKSRRGLVVLSNGDNGADVCAKIAGEAFDIGKELNEKLK